MFEAAETFLKGCDRNVARIRDLRDRHVEHFTALQDKGNTAGCE